MTGFRAILSSPHEQTKGAIDSQFLQVTFVDRLNVFFTLRRTILWIIYGIIEFVILLLPKRIADRDKRNVYSVISNIMFAAVSVIEIWCDKAVQPISRGGYISFCLWCSAAMIIITNRLLWGDACKYLMFFSLGYVLTYCFTSDNRNLFYGMDAAGTFVFFMWGYALSIILHDLPGRDLIRIGLCLPCVIGIMCFYGYVYRDFPVSQLDARVQTGIYTGLITTQSNSEYVQQLEKDLQEELPDDGTLCTVNNFPAAYLMARKEICAPQTWDAQFLARGYLSSEPLVSYFEAKDEMSEIFLASNHIDVGLYERESIELWDYLSDYYGDPDALTSTDGSRTMIWYKTKAAE